jgi:hypothetical protein
MGSPIYNILNYYKKKKKRKERGEKRKERRQGEFKHKGKKEKNREI